jgi:hypothetical protein
MGAQTGDRRTAGERPTSHAAGAGGVQSRDPVDTAVDP